MRSTRFFTVAHIVAIVSVDHRGGDGGSSANSLTTKQCVIYCRKHHRDMSSRPPHTLPARSEARWLLPCLLLVVAGLFAVTTVYASAYREQQTRRARDHFVAGEHLAVIGAQPAALDEYRSALLLVREAPVYERALVATLVTLGRYGEATTWATELLSRLPTDGPTNRAMGQIALAKGQFGEARAYYQRAIYGEWPTDAPTAHLDARFELAGLLQRTAAREEVLAELLRLKSDVPAEATAAMRRLAAFFLDAGHLQDANDVLRAAERRAPDDAALRADVQETTRTLALDPMLPGLRLRERTRRTHLLLAAVVAQTSMCKVEGRPFDLVQLAESQLAAAVSAADAAEDQLQIAERLWRAAAGCRATSGDSRSIARVLAAIDSEGAP